MLMAVLREAPLACLLTTLSHLGPWNVQYSSAAVRLGCSAAAPKGEKAGAYDDSQSQLKGTVLLGSALTVSLKLRGVIGRWMLDYSIGVVRRPCCCTRTSARR